MSENGKQQRYLEFSCESIELNIKAGETLNGSFRIYAEGGNAQGRIYSSDTRMQLSSFEFMGKEFEINYCFDAKAAEAGSTVKGEFDIISNCKEYTIPYRVNILRPQLECSIGTVKNMFHFTNLAQTNWSEAVELFFSPGFSAIFHKNDKNAWLSYMGLSKNKGNEQNVEEFLIEISKKTPVIYTFDIEGFMLEDVQDSTQRQVAVKRSGWGYSLLNIKTDGEFLNVDRDKIESGDFKNNRCDITIHIDASKLHNGVNSGIITFNDACNVYTLPVDILMDEAPEKRSAARKEKRALCNLTRLYADMLFDKITYAQWIGEFERNADILDGINEDDIMSMLCRTHLILAKKRTNEAKWYLENIEKRLAGETVSVEVSSYYFYLTTLLGNGGDYAERVCADIESAYFENPYKWQLGWFILQLKGELLENPQLRWKFLEEMYDRGCISPLMLCEAVLILKKNPVLLTKLGSFEEKALWFGAKNRQLTPELIEQMQYLETRKGEFSQLLLRTLCEVYYTYKLPQTVASICHMLILGDRRNEECCFWYALGVEHAVRVTKLYEYYMMSLPLDKYGDVKNKFSDKSLEKPLEIPKMVLMYFAYQSTLDYELNAFLYAYITKNKERYPDLEPSYRIAIERFVLEQLKAGHINENLAYLYKNVLSKQIITEETAYAFAPLLFMHRIYVDNPKVKNVVVIHEKLNGESIYPVVKNVCMLPVYGNEYKLFLQGENGNRFTKSIHYENKQLMEPEKQISCISGYMQDRLSFDMYMCELDKNYIIVTHENVRRLKNLAESELVVESFKREIRTRLLKFYYDNDMIWELDAFLEDIDAEDMEAGERAEFVRYMVSRGMFDKAYYWIKMYGVAGVEPKAVARLISKRILGREYEYDEFLVNVAYYIYRHVKYDENILRYLVRNYEGRVTSLKKLWRSAHELDLDTGSIMHKILRQIKYTGVSLAERDEILLEYADYPNHDIQLVNELLVDAAHEYFVSEVVVNPAVFDRIYREFAGGTAAVRVCKLALLKFWSDNPDKLDKIPSVIVSDMLREFLKEELFFPFYKGLVAYAPELHYIKNCMFVEYRTMPGNSAYIHYAIGADYNGAFERDSGDGAAEYEHYETEEMREMFEGIHVSMFRIFHGEAVQYYITEQYVDDDGKVREQVTHSDTLYSDDKADEASSDRFGILNDMFLSISMQDEKTASDMLEEYMHKDFCSKELFKVL